MQPVTHHPECLFDVGPVSLVRWREDEGRQVLAASGDLAKRLSQRGVDRLDTVLGEGDRRRLEVALAELSEEGGGLDLGPVALSLGGDEPSWFHLTALVERPEVGVASVTATFVDINTLKTSERALEEKSERLELVIEGTRLGTWDWNPQTGAVSFNEQWAQMLGYGLDEICFRLEEWETRVHPDDLQPCYEAIGAHLRGETSFYQNVHRMKHRDGHWVHILDRGRVVERDEEGQPVRFTGTHTDISPQREAEIAAQAASKIKTEFLATMSHEIRTPLAGMMGLLEVLKSTVESVTQREDMELMKRCGEHLGVVLDGVLELTRLESSKLELQKVPFDLGDLLQDLHRLFQGPAESKGIELRYGAQIDRSSWILGDRHRLRQVLTNLLSNAIKFTEQGHVDLSVWLEEAPLQLRAAVRDTGRGISDLDRIWNSFQQEDATISASHGGSGLGLTITQKLVHLMGGEICVESAPGEGSCFELRIPVERADRESVVGEDGLDQAPRADASAPDEAHRLEAPEITVLAADDNSVNRRILDRFLQRLGVDFELVSDGQEAIDAARLRTFDLVFMDLQMPKCNGHVAAEALRSWSSANPVRIVALTADVLSTVELEDQASPFDAVLTKPFCFEDVREQVLAAAAQSHPPR